MDLTTIPALVPYAGYITAAIGVCAIVSAALPPPKNPASVYAKIYAVFNFVAINFGHARNATAPVITAKATP